MFQQLVHRVSVFTEDIQDCFVQRDTPIFNKMLGNNYLHLLLQDSMFYYAYVGLSLQHI